jgi:transcriptional regulator with XRE-family HTH domain
MSTILHHQDEQSGRTRDFRQDSPAMSSSLGTKLRNLRRERELSQRDLAQQAGLSPNAISLIERDAISPSVATLQRLAGALGVKMGYFFADDPAEASVILARAGQRPAIVGQGLTIEGLGAKLVAQQLEPYYITLAPQANTGREWVVHTGHELVCCLAGQVEYKIDDHTYLLEPGDFLLFEAELPHAWCNPGPEMARLLLVLHAPGAVHDPAQQHFPGYPSVAQMG